MRTSLLLIMALLLTASCGKRTVKKKYVSFDNFSEASYVEDIDSFMPQLRAVFNDQMIMDHFSDDTDVIFTEMNVSGGIAGKSFDSLNTTRCSHYQIRPNSSTLLTIRTNFNTCLTPASQTSVGYVGQYDVDLNPDLKEAFSVTPDRIAVREVVYDGQVYVGFGIQIDSGFNLSNDYKEYVIIPDFPLILNPVLVHDSQTGNVRALKGIQVK